MKVSPDLEDAQICAVADAAIAQGCAGIVATNTLSRPANGKVMNREGRALWSASADSTDVIHMLYALWKPIYQLSVSVVYLMLKVPGKRLLRVHPYCTPQCPSV